MKRTRLNNQVARDRERRYTSAMVTCEFKEKCPMFARFRLDITKDVWIRIYCEGPRQNDCARKRLRLQGAEVPVALLPSGESLGEEPQNQ